MVETEIVTGDVNINLPSGQPFSFVDSIKNIFDGFIEDIMSKDVVALTAIFMSLMLIVAFVALWKGIQ